MSPEGKLVILDTFYKEAEGSDMLGSGKPNRDGSDQKDIFPFHLMKLENGMLSVCLDTSSYQKELFAKRNNEGIMGSGYDWEKAVSILRQELMPDWSDDVYFDSEADLFCAYSDGTEKFMEFITKLKTECEDASKLDAAISSIVE